MDLIKIFFGKKLVSLNSNVMSTYLTPKKAAAIVIALKHHLGLDDIAESTTVTSFKKVAENFCAK